MSKLKAWLEMRCSTISILNETHKQVPTKVTAYVDEAIKELVEAINSLEGIWTVESCQGNKRELVEIWAHYRSMKDYNYLDTVKFMDKLANAIRKTVIDEMGWLCHSIGLSLVWGGDMRMPCILIRCSKKDIKRVCQVLDYLRNEIQ